MRKRILQGVILLSVFAAIWYFNYAKRARSDRPSIVLIMIDALRADKLGVYGSSAPASQGLDRLAEEGVVFEKMIASASWTRSSIASLLTGLYPRRVGVVKEKWDMLADHVTTLAEVLQKQGYYTVGLTANPQLNRAFGFAQGFDHYVESSVLFSWMKEEAGKSKADGENVVRKAPDVLAEARQILNTVGTRPVYLQLLLMDVHAHHRIKARDVDSDLQPFPDSEYLQSVRHATHLLPQFIADMKAILGEDTLFVITSDHGEGLQDHPDVYGSKGHGNLLYRSQIHVPCIVLGGKAAVKSGLRISEATRLLDLMPTLAQFGGATAPVGIDGVSFLSALTEGTINPPREIPLSETAWRAVEKVSVTDGEWLYVQNRDDWKGTDREELVRFDAVQNGSRTNSLASEPERARKYREQLEAIEARLQREQESQGEPQGEDAVVSESEIEQLKSLGYLN